MQGRGGPLPATPSTSPREQEQGAAPRDLQHADLGLPGQLKQADIDIAAMQEVLWPGRNVLAIKNEPYTLFYNQHPAGTSWAPASW